jgi:antitoxin StbD
LHVQQRPSLPIPFLIGKTEKNLSPKTVKAYKIDLIDNFINQNYYTYNCSNKRSKIMPIKNYLSSTQLSKNTAAALNSFETGEIDKLIILKNNAPKAVLISMDAYESMEEEIEDLRLTALALSRIQNFDIEQTLSHEEMMYRHTK